MRAGVLAYDREAHEYFIPKKNAATVEVDYGGGRTDCPGVGHGLEIPNVGRRRGPDSQACRTTCSQAHFQHLTWSGYADGRSGVLGIDEWEEGPLILPV